MKLEWVALLLFASLWWADVLGPQATGIGLFVFAWVWVLRERRQLAAWLRRLDEAEARHEAVMGRFGGRGSGE